MTNNKDIQPVFRLHAKNKSDQLTLKFEGTCTPESVIGDQVIELTDEQLKLHKIVGDIDDSDKYALTLLKDHNQYYVHGKLYHCNMIGQYLVTNMKWPLIQLLVTYVRQAVAGYLFAVFLYFQPSEDDLKSCSHPKEYVNKSFNGTYTLEIKSDDDMFEKGYKEYMKQKNENITDEELLEYEKLMSSRKYKFTTFDDACNYIIVNICNNPLFSNIIKYSIYCREEGKQKEYQIIDYEKCEKLRTYQIKPIRINSANNKKDILERLKNKRL